MSQENIDAIRKAYEAFNDGEVDTILEMLDPEVELCEEPELPDTRIWHGREGARAYFAEGSVRWSEVRLETTEVIEAGDATIVVVGVMRGRGMLSGVEVESPFGHVYEVRDGKAVRVEFYLDSARALEAVRLKK